MKNKKGITLIALIITIIVMLILAGVAISMVVGENGVLTRAENAKVSQALAEIREKIDLSLSSLAISYYKDKQEGESKLDYIEKNLQKTLENELGEGNVSVLGKEITITLDSGETKTLTLSDDYSKINNVGEFVLAENSLAAQASVGDKVKLFESDGENRWVTTEDFYIYDINKENGVVALIQNQIHTVFEDPSFFDLYQSIYSDANNIIKVLAESEFSNAGERLENCLSTKRNINLDEYNFEKERGRNAYSKPYWINQKTEDGTKVYYVDTNGDLQSTSGGNDLTEVIYLKYVMYTYSNLPATKEEDTWYAGF